MIILISGKQGSGKTTLSQYLKDVLEGKGINVQIMKFASPLYLMHNEVRRVLQGFDPNNTLGYDFDKKDGTLLQLLGTDWGRNNIHKDVWAKLTLANAEAYLGPALNGKVISPRIVIIDDCRFPNELDIPNAESKHPVLNVRLECDRDIRKERCESWRDNEQHESETALDAYAEKFDLTFNTDAWTPYDCTVDILKALAVLHKYK